MGDGRRWIKETGTGSKRCSAPAYPRILYKKFLIDMGEKGMGIESTQGWGLGWTQDRFNKVMLKMSKDRQASVWKRNEL